MKPHFILLLFCACIGCQSKKESAFQLELVQFGKAYTAFRNSESDYDKYKARHDSMLWQAREMVCQKKYDTVTIRIKNIIDFGGEGSYEIACESVSQPLFYTARVRFKDSLDVEKSPFYKFRRSISKGDIIRIPIYMYEVPAMGLDNGSFEVVFWPIPDGVADVISQLRNDVYNNWGGTPADIFVSDDCKGRPKATGL
ncbi:hypothetical protein LZZ85_11240 [Terrimonas sp. NA20]|uniref:DUF3828 domain-containing protein n=1 Tax=Terrimonas ginsenosidimutans TaxID=2908004 RepID=A0ABS9KR98_9BACT|nr:hypothetical protein [Terrimonas ginsenosidimutans]MCG2614862.1 hypothetical protein [Terrimonas ginsenosidimutans]